MPQDELQPIFDPPELPPLESDEGTPEQEAQQGENGDAVAAVLEEYGNDPERLARALADHKAAQEAQGGELDQLKQQLDEVQSFIQQQQTGESTDSSDSDEIEALVKRLHEENEQGGDVFRTMVEEIIKMARSQTSEVVTKDQKSRSEMMAAQAVIAQRNPDLNDLRPVMEKIYRERPHMVRLDQGQQALEQDLQDLVDLARTRSGKQAPSTPQRRPVQMDPGRSNRISSTHKPPPASAQKRSDLMKRAMETNDRGAWRDLLDNVLFGEQ